MAITFDDWKFPRTNSSKCVGCAVCALKCFAGAIAMRARDPEELAALIEN